MKEAKEWFINVTFDMWQGYVCFVVYKSEHFNKVFTRFVYMHESKEAHDHIEALNHLASALKLSKEEQESHVLTSDGEALLISAWHTNFPHMLQKCCSLHFIKNIIDKLQYHLPH